MSIKELPKEVSVLWETEVLVVGGGPAGIAAALASSRAGAKTTILERFSCFGGNITLVGVESFAWYRHKATIEAGGIAREFEDLAEEMGASSKEIQSDSQALDAEMFKYLADRILLEAGVEPILHCYAVEAMVEDNQIKGVITESKAGRQAILAKRVIDCTGDGDIAALAGAPFTKSASEELMHLSPVFNCHGVDTKKFKEYIYKQLKPTYKDWAGEVWNLISTGKESHMFSPYIKTPFTQAIEEGLIEVDENVSLGGTWSTINEKMGEVTQLNMVFISGYDPLNVRDLTRAEIQGREHVLKVLKVLRHKVPGFQEAGIRNFAMTIGARESRKIQGHYYLRKEDVLNQARFEDSIGIFPEFVDGLNHLYIPTTGRYFQIPYRAILPKKIDNLLVAGRSISGDRVAHCAFRNMSCCALTGQAAGIAAAVSLEDKVNTSKINIKNLQKAIQKQGLRIY